LLLDIYRNSPQHLGSLEAITKKAKHGRRNVHVTFPRYPGVSVKKATTKIALDPELLGTSPAE
jgi:hypothetical protein